MADEKHDLEKVLHATPIDIIARETAGIRSHYPSSYGYGDGYGSGEQKIHLRELWRTVRKRKWLIVTIVFVITTLVTIEMYRTKDIFQASTMIEVGKDTSRLGSPGGNIFGDDYDPFYMVNMKTKMLMVKSHALLESVVVDNRLDQNPRFLGAG
ncbi:MAG TPA: Wzz/FepE/Etk N-terminal domain-containing protein, partial [Blastocatellia bacterium]|nr:Wzz/FepE/Etk N-terminal domain-containing protein [Blastocatellia bacterium]